MKIGVFVGSFDPVHNGHINLANYLVNKKIVDKVLIVPTGNYWDKQNLSNINHRLNMLNLVKNDNIIIDNKHNDINYTYELLNKLKEENSSNEYYLVIGADNANTLHKWKNYDELIKNNIIVINRDDIKINLHTDKLMIIKEKFGHISSTYIREKIKEKKYDDIKDLVNPDVFNYIIIKDLYTKKEW